MPRYVMLSHSPDGKPSCLIEEKAWEGKQRSFFAHDTPFVFKRFTARCWCEAKKIYDEANGHGDKDLMWHCDDDKKRGHKVCVFYKEVGKI